MFKQTVLAASVAAALAAGAAQAEQVTIDVSAAPGGNGIGASDVTDLFEQMQFYAETTTTQKDDDGIAGLSVGDSFSDNGNATIQSLLPPGSYGAGIGVPFGGGATFSELTVTWTGLTGELVGSTSNGFGGLTFDQLYTSGTFNFYFDQPGNADFGSSVGSGDDTGMTDGTLVLTLSLDPNVDSTGTLVFGPGNTFRSGSSAINTLVTYARPGFWFMNGTDDFADLLLNQEIILSFIDQNTDAIVQTPGAAGSGILFTIDSNHDGSIVFGRPVPVPGTVGLLGGALLALGAANLRKKKA
jgi:hypothetical protein